MFVRFLETAVRRAGGTTVRIVLDVERPATESFDPTPSTGPLLPGLEEALATGGFGRESFLRALVVQLAQVVERNGGPGMAEACVAQVAIDVGAQMELEYRTATAVFGGIAANSHGESAVVLDERIAVGDPECRVVIHLGHQADVGAAAHRYRGHRPEPDTRVTLHPRG